MINFFSIIKHSEIRLLGKHASTYCYNKPDIAEIEITNLCNLHCKWCSRGEVISRIGAGSMDIKNFKQIIPQLKGVKILHVFGVGEPLLYNSLIEAINYSARFIKFISITTNATLLNRDMSDRLANSQLSELAVSIDSTDRQIFEYIRETDFQRVIDNIKYFRSISSIPIRINSVVCKQNLESLKAMPELANELGVYYIQFNALHDSESSRKYNLTGDIPLDLLEEFINYVFPRCEQAGIGTNVRTLISRLKGVRGICEAPFTTLYINYLGYMTPCCSWTWANLSNMLESRFWRTWNSKEIRQFRNRMLQRNYPEHCKTWCNAVSLQETTYDGCSNSRT